MTRLTILLTLFAFNCTSDNLDATESALDTNTSGMVDCVDFGHVVACIEHFDPHTCAHADFTGDGVVDDEDAHAVHDALAADHHNCSEPEHHHTVN